MGSGRIRFGWIPKPVVSGAIRFGPLAKPIAADGNRFGPDPTRFGRSRDTGPGVGRSGFAVTREPIRVEGRVDETEVASGTGGTRTGVGPEVRPAPGVSRPGWS